MQFSAILVQLAEKPPPQTCVPMRSATQNERPLATYGNPLVINVDQRDTDMTFQKMTKILYLKSVVDPGGPGARAPLTPILRPQIIF